MPRIRVEVPYKIPQDEALGRIKARIAQAKSQYSDKVSNLTEDWDGYAGKISGSGRGISLSGNIDVNPSVVAVEIALPAAAIFVKGKIEKGIRGELAALLA
jgi:hypothetical protein